MNMMERGARGPAVLQYLDGEFRIVTAGAYVICAVTGAHIPLEDLRYWNVDLQEAYVNAEAANKRFRDTRKG
ncbi:MAG: DUF2093 domain-containing protein [Alphaproteobacteria bacterium]|nr:DUF2093 domain-containing protein [Alphaproteobacteria bacterium]